MHLAPLHLAHVGCGSLNKGDINTPHLWPSIPGQSRWSHDIDISYIDKLKKKTKKEHLAVSSIVFSKSPKVNQYTSTDEKRSIQCPAGHPFERGVHTAVVENRMTAEPSTLAGEICLFYFILQ